MKPGQNPKQRSRGRPNGNNNSGGKGRMMPRNTTFDSNGPDIRVRGNAHQVLEKYLALARDASSQGDRIAAENFYQHAEHYFRVINNQNQHNGGRVPGQRPISTPADDQGMLPGEFEGDGEGEDGEGGSSEESSDSDSESTEEESDGTDGEDRAQAVNA
jgi:hypothetical protein